MNKIIFKIWKVQNKLCGTIKQNFTENVVQKIFVQRYLKGSFSSFFWK